MTTRIYPEIIQIIEEHHEAYSLWENLRSKGFKNLTLLHVDSHSDMDLPVLSESIYKKSTKDVVEKQLKIDTFIAPSLLQGTVNRVIYVNPRGIRKRLRKRYVGSIKGEGIILKFDINDKYIFPDNREWYYKITPNISSVKETVILDIDLDYFSCNLFVHPQFKMKLNRNQYDYVNKFNTSSWISKYSLGFFDVKNADLYFKQEFKDLIYNDDIKSIDFSIERLIYNLKAQTLLVDICRSVKSGYTPKKYAKYIEEKLISTLYNPPEKKPVFVFSNIEIYRFIGWHEYTIFNPVTNKFKKTYEF